MVLAWVKTNLRWADGLMMFDVVQYVVARNDLHAGVFDTRPAGNWCTAEFGEDDDVTTMAQTSPMCLDVNGDMLEILHGVEKHACLDRLLWRPSERSGVHPSYPTSLGKENTHVSIQDRMKLFDAVVPCGIVSVAVTG